MKNYATPPMCWPAGKFKDENVKVWSYAVKAGDTLSENFQLTDFENEQYHLRVYGPNGFYREFMRSNADPEVEITCQYFKGTLQIKFTNKSDSEKQFNLTNNSYDAATFSPKTAAGSSTSSYIDVSKSHGWVRFRCKWMEMKLSDTLLRGDQKW